MGRLYRRKGLRGVGVLKMDPVQTLQLFGQQHLECIGLSDLEKLQAMSERKGQTGLETGLEQIGCLGEAEDC